VEDSPTLEVLAARRHKVYLANVWLVVALAPGLLVSSFPKLFGRELFPNLSGAAKPWVACALIAWALAIGAGPYRLAWKKVARTDPPVTPNTSLERARER
jgi:hypothetical protein